MCIVWIFSGHCYVVLYFWSCTLVSADCRLLMGTIQYNTITTYYIFFNLKLFFIFIIRIGHTEARLVPMGWHPKMRRGEWSKIQNFRWRHTQPTNRCAPFNMVLIRGDVGLVVLCCFFFWLSSSVVPWMWQSLHSESPHYRIIYKYWCPWWVGGGSFSGVMRYCLIWQRNSSSLCVCACVRVVSSSQSIFFHTNLPPLRYYFLPSTPIKFLFFF